MKHVSNIGYWQGLPHRTMALIALTLRQMFVNRYIWIAVLFLITPTIIASIFVYREPTAPANEWLDGFIIISMFLNIQFFVLFFPLLFSGTIFNEEMEKRTITYLMIKPLKRFEFVLSKYIGMVIGLYLMFFPAMIVMFLVANSRNSPTFVMHHLEVLGWMLVVVLLGLMAYGAIFTALSVIFKRPLMIGLLFAFIWEVFVVQMPGSIKRGTIMYYLRSILVSELYRGDLKQYSDMTSTPVAIIVLMTVVVVSLLIASVWISYKDMH